MKKKFSWVLVCLFLMLPFSTAFAKTVIKIANAGPDNPDNRTVKALSIFKYRVEKATKGEVEVQAFHASKLGDEREALEGIRMGTIQMGTLSGGPVPGFYPEVMIYDIPYLFSSAPAAWDFFESDTGKEFADGFLKKTGVRILATTENGYRHFTDNVRPIKSPDDIKGLKIRVMQNPAHIAMVKAMGGDPTPIAFGELYMALQQKVVDGMECPIVLINDMKFYEVQKYLVLDGHLYNPLFIFINDKFFNEKLTPEQRKVVQAAAVELAAVHDGFSQEANIKGIAKLKAKGMEIYQPTAQELTAFRNVAQPACLQFITEKIGKAWVDKALKGAATSEAKVAGKSDDIIQKLIKEANEKYAGIGK